eukprot:403374156
MTNSGMQSKMILEHLQECKKENQEKLKLVKNLEDLVKFKVATVADKIKDNSQDYNQLKGLEIFQKLCDPLLANQQHYPSLTKKAYLPIVNSKSINNRQGSREASKSNNNKYVDNRTSLPMLTNKNDLRLEQLPTETNNQQNYYNSQAQIPLNSLQSNNNWNTKSQAVDPLNITENPYQSQTTKRNISEKTTDPVKFLQDYFKPSSNKPARRASNVNYVMAKYERKFLEDKKKSMISQQKTADQQSQLNIDDDQISINQLPSSANMGQQRTNSQNYNNASFYSFMNVGRKQYKEDGNIQSNFNETFNQKNNEISQKNVLDQSQFDLHVEQPSMNILNFQRMKDEIKQLFNNEHSFTAAAYDQQNQNDYNENLPSNRYQETLKQMLNQPIPPSNNQDSETYRRHIGFKSVIQDDLMPRSSNINKTMINQMSYSNSENEQQLVSKNQNSNMLRPLNRSFDLKDGQLSFNKGNRITDSRDKKIQKIFRQELSKGIKPSKLTDIQQVKSIGFDQFQHNVKSEMLKKFRSQQQSQLSQYQKEQYKSQQVYQIQQNDCSQNQYNETSFVNQTQKSQVQLSSQHSTQLNFNQNQRNQSHIFQHETSVQYQSKVNQTQKPGLKPGEQLQPLNHYQKLKQSQKETQLNKELIKFNRGRDINRLKENFKKDQLKQQNLESGIIKESSNKPNNFIDKEKRIQKLAQASNRPRQQFKEDLMQRNNTDIQEYFTNQQPVLSNNNFDQFDIKRQVTDNLLYKSLLQEPSADLKPDEVDEISQKIDEALRKTQSDISNMNLMNTQNILNQELEEAALKPKQIQKVSFIKKEDKQQLQANEVIIQMPVESSISTGVMNQNASISHMQPVLNKKSSQIQKVLQQRQPKHQVKYSIIDQSGYLTQQEHPIDLASEELQNQLMEYAILKRKAWSPKRFKKFPRFTIFLNREEDIGKEYLKDNIISLNPEFMNYLLNSANPAQNPKQNFQHASNQNLQSQRNLINEEGIELENSQINIDQNILNSQTDANQEQLTSKQSQKNYKYQDPFDKVLLTKGIDNQILTSFRTLTKANNTVSDTMKIIHNKYSALPVQHPLIRKLKQKHQLYQINEEDDYRNNIDMDSEQQMQQYYSQNDQKDSMNVTNFTQQKKELYSFAKQQQLEHSRSSSIGSDDQTNQQNTNSGEPSQRLISVQFKSRMNIRDENDAAFAVTSGREQKAQNSKQENITNNLCDNFNTRTLQDGDVNVKSNDILTQNIQSKVNSASINGNRRQGDTQNNSIENSVERENSIKVMKQTIENHTFIDIKDQNNQAIESKQLIIPNKDMSPMQSQLANKNTNREFNKFLMDSTSDQFQSKYLTQFDGSNEDTKRYENIMTDIKNSQQQDIIQNRDNSQDNAKDTIKSQKYQYSMQRIDPSEMFGKQKILKAQLANLPGGQQFLKSHMQSIYVDQSMTQNDPYLSAGAASDSEQMMLSKNFPQAKRKHVNHAGGYQLQPKAQKNTENQSNSNPQNNGILNRKSSNQTNLQDLLNMNLLDNPQVLLNRMSELTNNLDFQALKQLQSQTQLNEEEKQDFARKLMFPPVNKLKNMINELYQKEKKYVRQYLREDYIEKNNFIFELNKSHKLHTNKEVKKRGGLSQERNETGTSINGINNLSSMIQTNSAAIQQQNSNQYVIAKDGQTFYGMTSGSGVVNYTNDVGTSALKQDYPRHKNTGNGDKSFMMGDAGGGTIMEAMSLSYYQVMDSNYQNQNI